MKFFLTLFLYACLLMTGQKANAQVLYGSIVGDVTDSTSAAIPSAQIKVLSAATGQQWELTTGSEGSYTINTLPPGLYRVTVTAAGFKSANRTDVTVTTNSTVRVSFQLEVGQVSESIEVSARGSTLKTDTMDVRSEIAATDLQNIPVPVTRNFQTLLVTVPGIAPPRDAHSISANPSRSLQLNANGTTAQSTAIRIDGATAWNSWLPHVGGYVPALEAIQAVNVQSSSYEAELGYAGGAAVNVTIKSGTNQVHGSAFEYHSNQHLKARPYFLAPTQGKNKRILNQFGGTVGGPIVKNRVFFFASYEGTPDRQSSFQTVVTPTVAMKQGNMSASALPIFDPLTGAANGSGRTPFSGNILPAARISPITKKLVDLTPNPNYLNTEALGTNYFANGSFLYDRHVLDTKFNVQATDRLNLAARVSYLDWNFDNPPLFGALGGTGIESRGSYDGKGLGNTLTMTYSAVYTLSPTVVIDGYVGYTVIDNSVENTRLDEKLGSEFLGIPGTNGPNRNYGGWPGFSVTGFPTYGRAQNNSPWGLRLPQSQYVSSLAWTKGKHNLRFGWDALWMGMDGNEPAGYPGGFTFNREVTGTVGTAVNDYNSYASFLLGLPNNMERRTRVVTGYTRTWAHSLYARDKWEVTKRLTLSLGLRWDYFGVPTRINGQGLEIFDFNNGQLKMCGVGSQPRNCGFTMSKRYFAPRVGFAYRPTDTFVIRAGYGIAWDPVNIGRNPLQTYPMVSIDNFPAANNYQFYAPIASGLPAVPAPDLGNGVVTPPRTVSLELADPNFKRSYIQAWNLMLEKDLGHNWVAEAGYVGNRQVNLQNRWNANYGFIGGGNASRVLNQKFGRTADTNFHSNVGGFRSWYDSLQSSLQKRYAAGYMLRFTYTWSKALGPRGNENGVDGYTNNTPEYFPLIAKVVRGFDHTHTFNAMSTVELPFGKGKKWATDGVGAMLLGGWQVNNLLTMYTGAPFSVTSAGGSLNAPGNGQTADQIKPSVQIFGSRDLWFDPTAYAPVTAVRFGTAGWDQLRGPGLVNLDSSVYRAFRISERFGLQFRAEAFNISNTPHFGNPRSDISSTQPGLITGVQNTGREGIDERMFRFGLRLNF
ncbi:MAG: TonB-dependent receptor [Acidobacteria bacterium]|nr:TonB-dependent receptor [Acidobacteriota bacterium]